MTAVLRRPAGTPEGGQFAPVACRNAYAALDALAAALDALPPGWSIDADNPQRVHLPWARCPHGHVAPWAIAACSDCSPAAPPAPGQLGDAEGCTGRREDGDRCTRRTTRRDRTGRAACHQHGGRPTP